MTLTPEQLDKLVLVYMNERWQYETSDGVHKFGDALWKDMLEDDSDYGVRFDAGQPDDIRRQVESVALAAQRDIVLTMIAAAPEGAYVGGLVDPAFGWDTETLQDWLASYLPAAPSPQEDQ